MKTQLIKELNRELDMRRRVYKASDAKNDRFLVRKEQSQFDNLKMVLHVIEGLTETQIGVALDVCIQKRKELAAQQELF